MLRCPPRAAGDRTDAGQGLVVRPPPASAKRLREGDGVTVAEFPVPSQDGPLGYREAAYDRTPPQDLVAEQCVLGGMLLSKDAIADVVEQIRGEDFYKPAHQTVYEAILDLYGRGVPAGFADLDALTNSLQAGQMLVIAARPAVGKSTLGLDIARSASIKHGLPSVIFSLEMSRNEIVMRLLSAEASVPLHHMRSGTI